LWTFSEISFRRPYRESTPVSREILPRFGGGVKKRRSDLVLSEVEGVNPEQAQAFRPGSRRVDSI